MSTKLYRRETTEGSSNPENCHQSKSR